MSHLAFTKARANSLQAFLAKSDGRDKLLATVQYAAMFISAGAAGDAKLIQGNVAAARKVFRVLRPLEALNPLLQSPALTGRRPLWLDLLDKLRPVFMAIYFGFDHVVWAKQAGLRKSSADNAAKISTYGWALGSITGVIVELHDLAALAARRPGETPDEYADRLASQQGELNRRTIVVAHLALQTALATGLLGLTNWSTRTIGLIGTATSFLNCYMLFPSIAAFLPKKPEVKVA